MTSTRSNGRSTMPLRAHRGVALWGENGMIELVTVIGCYCIVSLTLNSFEIPLSEAMQDPFPELP